MITLHNKINWISKPGIFYKISSINCKENVRIQASSDGMIKFDKKLRNLLNMEQTVYVSFPVLENINPSDDLDNLFYLYPQQGSAISNISHSFNKKYSSVFLINL